MTLEKRSGSRQRLQDAARALFAERGYEATTVAAIVKRAKTSYSQFISHFSDKAGVLAEILTDGWRQINSAIQLATSKISSPRDRLKVTFDVVISYLERDQAFRRLFLMEAATTHEHRKLSPSAGFSDFIKTFDEIFGDMARRGELSTDVQPQVLRSALVGALKGMLRDQLLEQERHSPVSYSESVIRLVFFNFVNSALPIAPVKTTVAEAPQLPTSDELTEGTLEMQLDQRWIERYLSLAAIALSPTGSA
jgi:AcrR family transcriptional regulator